MDTINFLSVILVQIFTNISILLRTQANSIYLHTKVTLKR